MLQTTAIPTPANDPIPWITRDLRKAGLFREGVASFDGERAATLLRILRTAVAALHDDGHPYRVVLHSTGTAATDLTNRVVQVSTSAMTDTSLTDGQRAAVLLGLVLHEVGHIRYHRDVAPEVQQRFGAATRAIHAISNIAADLHDERLAREAFPGAASAVDVTLWFVSGKGRAIPHSADRDLRTYAGRVNLLVGATRYPWNVTWDSAAAFDYLRWAQAWGRRCEDSHTPAQHIARIQEALDRIGHPDDATDDDDGGDEPGEGKGEGKGQPGDGQGQPGEGEPQDGDGDGDGQPGDGQDGQPGGQPGGEGEGDGAGDGGDSPADGPPQGGSLGGGGKSRNVRDEESYEIDTTTCASAKAREQRTAEDRDRDRVLQEAADTWDRGQRTGRNTRTYRHPGRWQQDGRNVAKRTWGRGGYSE